MGFLQKKILFTYTCTHTKVGIKLGLKLDTSSISCTIPYHLPRIDNGTLLDVFYPVNLRMCERPSHIVEKVMLLQLLDRLIKNKTFNEKEITANRWGCESLLS